MLILAAALVIIALLLLVAGGVWQIIAAFHEGLAWGLSVLFVPFANMVFTCARWEKAKGGFLCMLLGVLLLLGSYSVVAGFERNGGKLPPMPQLAFLGKAGAPPAKSGVADEGIFKAKKDAELQIKLVNLHTRETELRERKAALAPGDHAGAAALAAEIKKYNDDLQPVLLQVKDSQAKTALSPAPSAH